MSEIEKVQRYIDCTAIKPRVKQWYTIYESELGALYDEMKEDPLHTILLAFTYGRAKGYRAAKAEARR